MKKAHKRRTKTTSRPKKRSPEEERRELQKYIMQESKRIRDIRKRREDLVEDLGKGNKPAHVISQEVIELDEEIKRNRAAITALKVPDTTYINEEMMRWTSNDNNTTPMVLEHPKPILEESEYKFLFHRDLNPSEQKRQKIAGGFFANDQISRALLEAVNCMF
eukprot:TRINITY_DN839_c0_g1_i1.p1 TRINITY_DN839_c0_g1~~TRINITY_DN839_c0_g1_i1.p1  ORF type:complete len:163 (-),score=42.99 TRINITY_DN839_c0_g1_i1:43-531(-)